MSDSLRPHGPQPTRLLHPWDFPGKTGLPFPSLKWDLLKLKSFCTIKEMMDKMKRDWEKTFANDVTNKGLVLLNSIKVNNPINN